MSKVVFSMMDHEEEKSPATIYAGDITAVSLPGFLTQFGALRTAIEGITIGVVAKEQWIGDETVLSSTPPTNGFAQRETKWLVRYRGDTTEEVYRMEIGTADLALLPDGDEFLDITAGAGLAFVTAFEAIARTPEDSAETVTVISVQHVGRNS